MKRHTSFQSAPQNVLSTRGDEVLTAHRKISYETTSNKGNALLRVSCMIPVGCSSTATDHGLFNIQYAKIGAAVMRTGRVTSSEIDPGSEGHPFRLPHTKQDKGTKIAS